MSLHNIRNGKVCEGHPISKSDLNELCELVIPEIGTSVKYIPENLLSYSPVNRYGSMAWWMPSCRKNLFFDIKGIRNGSAPVPASLFAIIKGKLHVWALKTNKRPTLETPAYHSPYFNVSEDGAVCMGNMKTPKRANPSRTRNWEELFFGSAFTNDHPPVLKGTAGEELWKSLIKTKADKFPNKHLKKWGTLNSVLNRLGG